jgi:outer membrane protein OmpA-like peptidoglycan-associated protein
MKKILFLICLTVNILYAGLYDYEYNVNSQINKPSPKLSNKLMYGEFEKIIRFEPLIFDKTTNNLKSISSDELDKIVDIIEKYKKRKPIVTIIGYRKHIETHNEKIIRKSSFSYSNLFPDSMMGYDNSDDSFSYAKTIKKYLEDKDINKDILVTETRRGDEKSFTEGIQKGKELNYRVMVSIYIPFEKLKPKPKKIKLIDLIIYYPNDSAIISKNQISKVKKFAKFLKKYPQFDAKITGYTSSAAPSNYNENLSIRRAVGVVEMLKKFGINPKRLSVLGKGERGLFFTKDNKESPEKSRRVEAKPYKNGK